jgi:hypothetical protein
MNAKTPIIILVDVSCEVDCRIRRRRIPSRFQEKGRYAHPESERICRGWEDVTISAQGQTMRNIRCYPRSIQAPGIPSCR